MREIRVRCYNLITKRKTINSENITRLKNYGNNVFEDSFVWVLLTGLPDKNKTEICEGDIAIYAGKKVVVTWNTGAFHLDPINDKGYCACLSSTHNQLEITGNIYENPELVGN